MRTLLATPIAVAGLLGCTSAVPPLAPHDRDAGPRGAGRFAEIVPTAGETGYRICMGCAASAPTPKTVGNRPTELTAVAAIAPEKPVPASARFAASIPFAFASDALDGRGRAALDAFVARLPASRRLRVIRVAGRTDNVGGAAANARLARARAETVLAALRARLQPEAEALSSAPRCCYRASNATAAGRADNRRVEVVAIVDSD